MESTIWAGYVAGGWIKGGALGPAGLRVIVEVDPKGRAKWRLVRGGKVLAHGAWRAWGTPMQITQDGAERALVAAWKRGES